jgi:hypothetical protein
MSTAVSYLFDNAVMNRYAMIATGHAVEPEVEFAERLLLLATFPPNGTVDDADSFLDRVAVWRREAAS